jgi:hypothetical protein
MRSLAVAALALSACSSARTEVVVVVRSEGLQIPIDIDQLHLTVTSRTLAGQVVPRFDSQRLPLCGPGQLSGCYPLPLTLTLIPGDQTPDALVSVQVEALLRETRKIGDEASFTFLKGQSAQLDFILYADCLDVDCTQDHQACNQSGKCATLDPPHPFTGGPQLDGPPPPDMAQPADLTGADLAGRDLSGVDLTVTPGADLGAPSPWLTLTSPTVATLNAVWGTSASDVYAVGAGSTVLHATDGYHFAVDTTAAISGDLYAVGGGAPVRAVGTSGNIYQKQGSWIFEQSLGPQTTWRGIATSGATTFLVGTGSSVSVNTGLGWSTNCINDNGTDSLHAVWWSGVGQPLVAGVGGYIALIGGGATMQPMQFGFDMGVPGGDLGPPPPPCLSPVVSNTSLQLDGIWGASNNVLAVGVNQIIDVSMDTGRTWLAPRAPSGHALSAIWGTSDGSTVYAVGDAGSILVRSPATAAFAPEASPVTTPLYGVWGFDGGPVFAVGAAGVILRRN